VSVAPLRSGGALASIYRVSLVCEGISPALRPQAAIDVAEEFTHRRHHEQVRCTCSGIELVLPASNDFDTTGEALADEFFDSVAADVSGEYRIRLV
jgi:hypothetical protein